MTLFLIAKASCRQVNNNIPVALVHRNHLLRAYCCYNICSVLRKVYAKTCDPIIILMTITNLNHNNFVVREVPRTWQLAISCKAGLTYIMQYENSAAVHPCAGVAQLG